MDPSQREFLDGVIAHWAASGLVSPEQAAAMRADAGTAPVATEATAQPEPPIRREHVASLVVEALGYLGGVIILVALGLVASRYWTTLPTAARIAITAVTCAAVLAAGAAVPQRLGPPGVRLRSVLWVAATAAWAGLAGLIVSESLGVSDESLGAIVAICTLPFAGLLWYLHRQSLQHVACLAVIVIGTGTAVSLLPGPEQLPGLMVWSVGLAWFVLAWGGIVRPRELGLALGSAVAIIGAMAFSSGEPSAAAAILDLVTLAVFVLASVAFGDFVLLVIAALGTLLSLPQIIQNYFPGALSAALALLAVGCLLIGIAIVIARRRRAGQARRPADRADAERRRDWRTISTTLAWGISAVAVAGTAAAVLIISRAA